MNTWLDDLETMTAANPLARLPHVESFDRFKKRLKAMVQDALRQASKDDVARKYSVADVIVNDPPLTEAQVRDGADDFSAIVMVQLLVAGPKGRA